MNATTNINDRLQLTMVGDVATYLREYAEREQITAAEAVRRSLQLLHLVDDMAPSEYLAVVNENDQTMQAVELPWRERLARRLPVFGTDRPSRRRAHRAPQFTAT